MKKLLKTTAAVLALSLASGGLLSSADGTNVLEPTIAADAAGKTVELDAVNVALDDSITLRFYATKESVDSSGADSVVLNGKNGKIEYSADAFEEKGAYYVFSYPLYANQLDESVSIYFANENTVIKSNVNGAEYMNYNYSVDRYCDYVTAPDNDAFDEKTKKAVTALKNLGLAAENYFDNGSYEVDLLDSDYDLSAYAPVCSDDVKFSLVLNSKFSARVYIPDLEDDASSGIFTAVAGKGGKNCFEVTGLKPTELDGSYVINYGGETILFSPLSFCYRAISNHSEQNSEIAKAIYEFYKYTTAHVDRKVKIEDISSNHIDYEFDFTYGTTWDELRTQVPDPSLFALLYTDNETMLIRSKRGYVYLRDAEEIRLIKKYDMVDENMAYKYDSSQDLFS